MWRLNNYFGLLPFHPFILPSWLTCGWLIIIPFAFSLLFRLEMDQPAFFVPQQLVSLPNVSLSQILTEPVGVLQTEAGQLQLTEI